MMKVKNLIHLTYQTSRLSLAYLQCAQNTSVSLRLGKIISHKAYFLIKYQISHFRNVLNIVLKVINKMVEWVQSGCKCLGCLPFRLGAVLVATAPAPREGLLPPTASPGKIKFQVQFLLSGYLSPVHHCKVLKW